MSIYIIYRASVTLPGEIYGEIVSRNKEAEFDREFISACTNTEASGTNTYADCEMWAETPVRSQAELCNGALKRLAAKWTKWAVEVRNENKNN